MKAQPESPGRGGPGLTVPSTEQLFSAFRLPVVLAHRCAALLVRGGWPLITHHRNTK